MVFDHLNLYILSERTKAMQDLELFTVAPSAGGLSIFMATTYTMNTIKIKILSLNILYIYFQMM